MVIENLDDLDLTIMRYILVWRGAILFTTRDERIIGRHLPLKAKVEIREMSDQEAFETFLRLLGDYGAAADRRTSKLLLDRFEKHSLGGRTHSGDWHIAWRVPGAVPGM